MSPCSSMASSAAAAGGDRRVRAYAAREVRPGAEVEPSATFARPSAASSIRSARARSARWSTATGGSRARGAVGRRRLDHAVDPAREHQPEHDRPGRAPGRADARGQLNSRSSGQTTRSTRAKAPRCRRSGVSCACGAAARRGRRASLRAPRRGRARGGRSCRSRCLGASSRGRGAARRGQDRRLHAARGPATGERSSKRVPRPTSSRESARRTSASRWVRRRASRGPSAPRWSACPV